MSINHKSDDVLLEGVERILSAYREACRNSCGDFAQVEAAANRAIKAIRPLLMSAGLSDSAAASPTTYACPSCGHALVRHSRRERRVVTSEGEATFVSTRWRCRPCGRDFYPLEAANGLQGSHYTTTAKGLIAGLASEVAFSRVAAMLSDRGVSVSAKEVDRTVKEVSEWRHAEELAGVRSVLPSKRKANGTWYRVPPSREAVPLHDWSGWHAQTTAVLSVDGGKVRSPEAGPDGLEWFECRVGIIAPADGGSRGSTFYVGGVLEPDELFRRLYAGWQSAPTTGRRALFIADGAEWIWGRASLMFPGARQVLDIYHAAEHVASAAIAAWGEQSARARSWRRQAREMLLRPGGPAKIIATLCAELEQGTPADTKALAREIEYLRRHAKRMPYAELRAQDLPVGSGAMESAIKQTSTQRLRQPGMMWSRRGADSMLRVRAAHLGGNLTHTVARKHQALRAGALQPVDACTA